MIDFRVTGLAFVAICLAAASSASAQTTFKMNASVPKDSHYGAAIDTFADEVEKRTEGRYRIENFYASALGNEREAIEAVQLGTLDLAISSTGPVPNFVPELAILDIPFLFRDYEHARSTLDGPIGQEMLKKFEPVGIKALAWAENGFRHMTNSKRAVRTPEDLKGLKLRTMENPIHMQAYKGFGIIPTPMAISEVFTALQQGTVDGQENPISVIQSFRFDQVQKHLTLTGHVYSPAFLMMNKDLWDGLSDEDKQHFLAAAQVGVKANRARNDEDEKNGVTYLRSQGMEVVDDVDRTVFQKALEPVFADLSKRFGEEEIRRLRDGR